MHDKTVCLPTSLKRSVLVDNSYSLVENSPEPIFVLSYIFFPVKAIMTFAAADNNGQLLSECVFGVLCTSWSKCLSNVHSAWLILEVLSDSLSSFGVSWQLSFSSIIKYA